MFIHLASSSSMFSPAAGSEGGRTGWEAWNHEKWLPLLEPRTKEDGEKFVVWQMDGWI